MTVNRVHVLATPGLDSHGAYVSLSRHRDGVELHYGRDDFADQGRLVRTLSRDRSRDMATDYERAEPAQAFAERRGITIRERVAEIVQKVPEKARGIFDGLRLSLGEAKRDRMPLERPAEPPRRTFDSLRANASGIDPAEAAKAERERARSLAIQRHARAVSAIWKMEDQGLPVLPHQQVELDRAREDVSAFGRHAVKDVEQAYSRDASLAQEASGGRIQRVMRAMQLEAEIRVDPERRAERFVEKWQKLDRDYHAAYAKGDYDAIERTRSNMGAMAKSLERDPQMESVLRQQRERLGVDFDTGRKLAHDLAGSVGIEMGHSRGLSR